MESLLNKSPTYYTSHPTRSHREIKCWPVVSCELIGSAAICIYSYKMQCCRPYAHTHTHTTTTTHHTITTYKKRTHIKQGPSVWQYWQDLTGLMNDTRARACLQRRKMHKSSYKHAQQAGTITCKRNLTIPVDTQAKKLFVRASSSDSWRAICADDFEAKSCALRLFHATDTCQTLAYVIHGAHSLLRRSCHFSVATM